MLNNIQRMNPIRRMNIIFKNMILLVITGFMIFILYPISIVPDLSLSNSLILTSLTICIILFGFLTTSLFLQIWKVGNLTSLERCYLKED